MNTKNLLVGIGLCLLSACTEVDNKLEVEDVYKRQLPVYVLTCLLPGWTLITVGKTLEARSKGKTTDALKRLMKLAPKSAVILKDGEEKTVPIDTVQKDLSLIHISTYS